MLIHCTHLAHAQARGAMSLVAPATLHEHIIYGTRRSRSCPPQPMAPDAAAAAPAAATDATAAAADAADA